MTGRPEPRGQARRTIPSNRLSHGLTSRAVAEARAVAVRDLARALAGEDATGPHVQEAAEDLAEAMMSLKEVRRAKIQLLSWKQSADVEDVMHLLDLIESIDGSKPDVNAIFAELEREEDSEWWGLTTILTMPLQERQALARLEEYERKTHSRYRRLVTRLDHALIEARRNK